MKSRINFFNIAMILMLIQILLGISVREFVDNQIDILGLKKDIWLKTKIKFYVHRTFSLLVFLSNVTFILAKILNRKSYKHDKFLNIN